LSEKKVGDTTKKSWTIFKILAELNFF